MTSSDDRILAVRCHELGPQVADLTANCALVETSIRAAVAAGVQLLVLPELVTSGYCLTRQESRSVALPADAEIFSAWARLLGDETVAVLGFCEAAGEDVYNSAVVLAGGQAAAIYRKSHLWDTEKEIFSAGKQRPPVVETPIGRLGVLICYDLEFPEMPRQLALAGADVIAVPTNWPLVDRPAGEHPPEVIQAMAAARASSVAVLCCDRRKEERGTTWTQGTTVVAPDGWLTGSKTTDGRLDVTLSLTQRRRTIGPRNDVFQDRRPELY